VAKDRRKRNGGDVTLIVGGYRLGAARYQVSTGTQPFAAKRRMPTRMDV